MSFLIFLGALVGLVGIAVTVNTVRGVRAHYLDDWRPEEGERTLFRDEEADTVIVCVNRATFVSYARPRRGIVIVTNKRILAGTRVLFGRKRMLEYVMYTGSAPDEYSAMIDGGLFTVGYRTLVFLPDAIERVTSGKKPYVELKPSPSERSSINIDFIRIYTDRAQSFPVPELGAAHRH
jgi:hypothetical protein